MMIVNGELMFIGDATINIYPDARTLAEIAIQTAKVARRFGVKPKVAMLSFSNFGTSEELRTDRIEEAIEIVKLFISEKFEGGRHEKRVNKISR